MKHGINYEMIDRKKRRVVRVGKVLFVYLLIATLIVDIYGYKTAEDLYNQRRDVFYEENSVYAGSFERTSKNFNKYYD